MIYLRLFLTFFKIGFFAVGGAYSFIPLMEAEVVTKNAWLTRSEFLDILGVTSIFPGAISIKFSTYVGYKIAGIPGVICANIGNFLPPAVIIIAVSVFYNKYRESASVKSAFSLIRIAVFAMIIASAFRLAGFKNLMSASTSFIAIMFLAVFLTGKIHPAFIIIGAGLLGAIAGY